MSLEESQKRLRAAGRNDACPCGSGKKYKKCHRAEDESVVHAQHAQQKAVADAAAEPAAAAASDAKAAGERSAKPKSKSKVSPAQSREQRQGATKSHDRDARAANLPRRGAV